MLRCVAFAMLLLFFAASPVHSRQTAPPDFDAYIEDMRERWSIPGVAVAIAGLEGAAEIRTYGRRQWDRSEKIDARTMFGIASITKTFVAAGVARLVDEGKLEWDAPVARYLPEFAVADPFVSREVTLRDLLSHRSGFATYGDWLEETPGLTEAGLLARLRHVGQAVPFRSRPRYNNYGFVVLAQVIERVTGQTWGDYLRDAIWRPLGMNDTHARADDFVPAAKVLPTGDGWDDGVPRGLAAVPPTVNVAAPHLLWEAAFEGKIVYDARELANSTAHFHRTAIDPSQAVFSSIGDMARWAQFLMRAEDGPILSAKAVRTLRQLTSVSGSGNWMVNQEADRLKAVGYGLGMQMFRYRDHNLFGHDGSELGYGARMVIDPAKGFAIVVLINNQTRTFTATDAIVQPILDHLYGYAPSDWSSIILDEARRTHAEYLDQMAALERGLPKGEAMPLPLAAYTGTYRDDFAGDLRIVRRGKRLVATTGPSYEIELTHWGGNRFRGVVVSPLRLATFVHFDVKEGEKRPTALSLDYVEIPETSLSFARVEQDDALPTQKQRQFTESREVVSKGRSGPPSHRLD